MPISTNIYVPQRWDKVSDCVSWLAPCLWLAEVMLLGHLLPRTSLETSKAELGGQFHGCNLKVMQFHSLCFRCCFRVTHEWDFMGQFKYEM